MKVPGKLFSTSYLHRTAHQIGSALVQVNGKGQVIWKNAAAENVLRDGNGLAVTQAGCGHLTEKATGVCSRQCNGLTGLTWALTRAAELCLLFSMVVGESLPTFVGSLPIAG